MLAFRIDVVASPELIWSSARVASYNPVDNNLAILMVQERCEELREATTLRDLSYKTKTTWYHNAKVIDKELS